MYGKTSINRSLIMASITNHFNQLLQDFRKYIETRMEYAKLDVTEKTVRIVTLLITLFLLTLVIFPFFLFLSFAASYFIGQLLNSVALGFLIVSGVYFVLGMFILILRKPLIMKPMLRMMVKTIFDQPNGPKIKFEDEDEE